LLFAEAVPDAAPVAEPEVALAEPVEPALLPPAAMPELADPLVPVVLLLLELPAVALALSLFMSAELVAAEPSFTCASTWVSLPLSAVLELLAPSAEPPSPIEPA
jgi:hypothetical protein